MVNKMRAKALFYWRQVVLLHLVAVSLLFMHPVFAQDGESAAVVYRLYKDYGWEALFSFTDDAKKIFGNTLLMQPKGVLAKYFDDELVLLFLKEANCVAKNPGELCRLDFNPIFASQDASASELSIKSINPRRVDVQFFYPSNHEKIRLSFIMSQTPKGWRIRDIKYPDSHTSLKDLLVE
jgi:hypothetical protein